MLELIRKTRQGVRMHLRGHISASRWIARRLFRRVTTACNRYAWRARKLMSRRNFHLTIRDFDKGAAKDLSDEQLLAFMRHDAHRIEKAYYNSIFLTKREYYEMRKNNIMDICDELGERGFDMNEPTVQWAKYIGKNYDNLEEMFIAPKSISAESYCFEKVKEYVAFARNRRSSRVWSREQLPSGELLNIAMNMIEAGCSAPTSGNRQPWRFRIILENIEKQYLKGIKEEHCYTAPCLIFLGMDRRVYGALGSNEDGIKIDAGAAAMNMVMTAHAGNLGVCWNHFSQDLIRSRSANVQSYRRFAKFMGIPSYVEPIAIIAFGLVDWHPPVPVRRRKEDLLISGPGSASSGK